MNSVPKKTRELSHLARIRLLPRLTRAEERALAVRALRGDAAAKQELVHRHLPLAISVARKQRRGTVRLEDLVQEGSVGLLRAAESYDPRVGTRFSVYALWWIRAYIGKYLKEARSSVRPRTGTVAREDVSLDAAMGGDDGPSHLECLEDERETPEEECGRTEGDREVRVAIGRVRPRIGELGWDIIQHRLSQETPESLEQIGRRWGLSRERVRQVELATRDFLRRFLQPIYDRKAA